MFGLDFKDRKLKITNNSKRIFYQYRDLPFSQDKSKREIIESTNVSESDHQAKVCLVGCIFHMNIITFFVINNETFVFRL